MTTAHWVSAAAIILALAAVAARAAFILRPGKPGPRLIISLGDITAESTDVIVNAAKSSLLGGGGVDGAIHKAGGPAILAECRLLRTRRYPGGLPVGQAVETTAGHLKANWVIHTVGPFYNPAINRAAELRSCYANSLTLAESLGARSISFPLISSGVYGWPKDDAVKQFLAAVKATPTKLDTIRLVLFDEATFHTANFLITQEYVS